MVDASLVRDLSSQGQAVRTHTGPKTESAPDQTVTYREPLSNLDLVPASPSSFSVPLSGRASPLILISGS